MDISPVQSVVHDKALLEQLLKSRVEQAFKREIADRARTVPHGHLSAGDIALMHENAVEAALVAGEEEGAFFYFRSLGWDARGGVFNAFEDLFRTVDADLQEVVAMRCAATGYTGPLSGPKVVLAGYRGMNTSPYIGIPHPELCEKGEFIAVRLHAGALETFEDGRLEWFTMPWHWIEAILEDEVPDFNVAQLMDMASASLRREREQRAKRQLQASAPEDIFISEFLDSLIEEEDEPQQNPGLAEPDAIITPLGQAVTEVNLLLLSLGRRHSALRRAFVHGRHDEMAAALAAAKGDIEQLSKLAARG